MVPNRIGLILPLIPFLRTDAALHLPHPELHQEKEARQYDETKAQRPHYEVVDAETSIRIGRNKEELLEHIFPIFIEQRAHQGIFFHPGYCKDLLRVYLLLPVALFRLFRFIYILFLIFEGFFKQEEHGRRQDGVEEGEDDVEREHSLLHVI